MEFYNQWTNRPVNYQQEFKEPTCTVPNQSMTVQQIIAKYSRTGLVPQSFARKDEGGNVATDPGFDPLDEAFDVLEEAAAARVEGPEGGAENDLPSGGASEAGGAQGAQG